VTEYDIEGKPLIELPVDSNPAKTVSKIVSSNIRLKKDLKNIKDVALWIK